MYMITVIFFYLSIVLQNINFMMPYINTFTIILLIFGIDLILFAYLCGFLFSKSNSAFKAFPLINFFLIYSVPWVLVNIFSRYAFLSKLMQIIAFIFSPFYVLDKGIFFFFFPPPINHPLSLFIYYYLCYFYGINHKYCEIIMKVK